MECRYITLDLIRKRSEHNECLVSNLEEIALHQEELEAIGPILGRTCGKTLRILLLQNNVISSMDPSHLRPFRNLEYLNLALNNIKVVEGISHLEFLNKLDLTLNFIGVESLKKSVNCLSQLRNLRELYMIGNPCICTNKDNNEEGALEEYRYKPDDTADRCKDAEIESGWKGSRKYIVAKVPTLQILDGKQVLHSDRIRSMQNLSKLELELDKIAQDVEIDDEDKVIELGESELTHHTPEARAAISREMAEQKLEKEKNEKTNLPVQKGEKDFELEHQEAKEKARKKEENGKIRQCNEGKWTFSFDESKQPGYILLDVSVQKYLSSSLIDVDVHPTYVSIVIKSKVLRLLLPAEVRAAESTAQRSITTGHLLLTMPKCHKEKSLFDSCQTYEDNVIVKKNTDLNKNKTIGDIESALRNGKHAERHGNGKVLYKAFPQDDKIKEGVDMTKIFSKTITKNDEVQISDKIRCQNNEDNPPPLF